MATSSSGAAPDPLPETDLGEVIIPAKSRPERVSREPAFVLVARLWSETSLIAELFTKSRGRIAVRVRGAKRPASPWRGIIAEFCPLLVSWSGSGPTKTLTKAEWLGGFEPVEGDSLLSAFYLNELLLRLTAREDPAPELFDAYWNALKRLSEGAEGPELERVLRGFEVRLLRLVGYGLPEAFEDGWYTLEGPALVRIGGEPGEEGMFFPADELRRIASMDFSRAGTMRCAKTLLRSLIAAVPGGAELNTRRIFAELRRL